MAINNPIFKKMFENNYFYSSSSKSIKKKLWLPFKN